MILAVEWFSIIGLIASLTGVGSIVSFLITQHLKEKKEKKKEQDKEYQDFLKHKRQDEIREVMQEELAPMNIRLDFIETNVDKLVKATVLNERCNMKVIYDRCKAQGYSDVGDKITMEQLYDNYKENGGNEFKKFVDKWAKFVKELPDNNDNIE